MTKKTTNAAEANAEENNRQGVSHCKAGAIAKGAECFRQAISLSPDSYQYHLNLGNALNEMGMWDEAEKVLCLAFSLSPNQSDIHKAVANAYVGLERSE